MNGRVLAQRYRLLDKLGEGGMGSVWRAEHLELGTLVAVKLISEEVAKNPEALARFRREAHAAAALRSPHVVQILDYGVDGDTPFMVMELLDGESLADRLARRGSLDLHETSKILSQVARAVAKAHSFGIVHRDLKPDNIFLVSNDDEEVAKVLDFGIAKATGGPTGSVGMMTGTGVMLGTPYYMSPEQAAGKREVDHRTDTWALAVIAYQCVVGHPPFRADTIGGLVLAICTEEAPRPSHQASLDPRFDAWFLQGVQRDPDRRFQSARELADSLRTLAEGLDQRAYRGAAAPASGSIPGPVVPQAASVRGSFVSTTAQSTNMTQSVIERPATKRSPLLVAGLVLAPILAVGGYAAYRGLNYGDASSTAATASSPPASEPAATTTARPSDLASSPVPQPAPGDSPAATSDPEPPPPDEFVDVAPAPVEAVEPAKPRRRSSAPKATAAAKPVAQSAPARPVAPSPSETSKPSAPSQKPSEPPAKPAERPKIDLAF